MWDSNAEANNPFWPTLHFDQLDFVQLELSSTQCTQQEFLRKYTTHPKEKLIWDSAKVDDKNKYWQKYREKEEEIELDKDEKDDKIPNTKHVV